MSEYNVVGKGLPRVDGPAKATGKARFTVDVNLSGMLYGKILRSPYPHARILNVDTSEAEKLPGVRGVITGEDLKDVRYAFVDTPRYPADEQPLAVDKVRYIGDEVAAVAADSESIAEEALSLIKVEYQVLPPVFTAEEAMQDDAPLIHDEELEGTSAWEEWGVAQKKRSTEKQSELSNISGNTFINYGDVQEGFAAADYIREDTFELKATAHCQMEPHAAVASFDEINEKLHVWISTMGIFLKRFFLSKTLQMPTSKIRVHHTYVGGAFGGKIDLFSYEYCAACLALKTGRPVKIELEREEVFMTTRQRHPMNITVKTGVKKDGTIIAQDIKVIADNGAYRGSGPVVIFLCHGFSFPIYNIPNYRYEGISVYTNNPIRGPQRGHGAPQIRFSIDSHIDLLARDMGMDPVEIMLKNVREQGDALPNGDVLNSCGLTECIEGAMEAINWQDKRQQSKSELKNGRYQRGLGVSLCSMFSGAMYYPFASAAIVKMHDDGSATLFTGAQDIGQGSYTTLSQVLAEVLGIGMEDVHVVAGDTDLCPIDLGSFLSGTALVTGSAVRLAALDAKKQIIEGATDLLGVDDLEELEAEDKKVFLKEDPERFVSYQQAIQASVLKRGGNPVIGTGSYKGYEKTDRYPSLAKGKGLFTGAYGFAAQAAEVEVDTWTGRVKLVKAVTFHDCGYPLNKTIVEGQIHGCASMGAGQALSEEVYLEEGQLFNASFLQYRLPISLDTPEAADGIVATHEPSGPFGAKEVGEGSVAGMLGAVANAVHDAIGVRIKSLPITPEKVLRGLGRI